MLSLLSCFSTILLAFFLSGCSLNSFIALETTKAPSDDSFKVTSPAAAASLKGGNTHTLTWTGTNPNLADHPITFEYSLDSGTNWTVIATAIANSHSYTWNVPPMIDSPAVLLRGSVLDSSGVTTVFLSETFSIDSTPPAAPTVSLSSATPTKSKTAVLAVTCDPDFAKVFISETATAPLETSPSWKSCTSSMSFDVATTDGTHTIYVWTKDLAGNISTTSSSVTMSLDQTSPSLTLTSLNSGAFKGGTTQNITWTASDVNFGATPITIAYSSDGGSHWTNIATVADTPATYAWTLPSIDSAQVKVRLTAVDSVNNPATVVTSSSSLTIDSTAPTISSVTISGPAVVSNNTLAFTMSAADNLTGVTGWRFGPTSDLSTAVWQTSLPSSYSFPFVTGTYSLYVQVKDAVGNISTVKQSSNSVFVVIGQPPVVNFIKPDSGTIFPTTPSTVHISWNIATPNGYSPASNGVNVFYSVNEGLTYTPWPAGQNLSPTQNASCVLDSGATGCVDLALPPALAGNIFQIIMFATDTTGAQGLAVSPKYNIIGGLNLIAGRNSAIMGGQALATTLATKGGIARDPVDGSIYFNQNCQIARIDGQTGLLHTFAGNPADCSTSVENLPPDQIRFNNSYTEFHMLIDSQRNLYWPANDPGLIYRYNRNTNLVDIYIGCIDAPCSINSGTQRRSFNLPGAAVSRMFLGANDRVYFAIFYGVSYGLMKIYRVEADDTVTLVAGKDTDTATATEGALATAISINEFVVVPGTDTASDTIYFAYSGAVDYKKIWKTKPDSTVTFVQESQCSYTPPLVGYLPSRNLIVTSFYGHMDTLDIATNTVTCDVFQSGNGNVKQVSDDGFGGFYYTGDGSQQIDYYSKSNTNYTYAGTTPYSGDGGPATQAEIRSPRNVTMDTLGNLYFVDDGNKRIRKIDTSHNISTLASPTQVAGVNPSTGTTTSPWISDIYEGGKLGYGRAILDINNITAGSILFKKPDYGAVTNPNDYMCTASSSADPVNGLSFSFNNSESVAWGALVAFDSITGNKYLAVYEMGPNFTGRSYIKKINSNNTSFTEVAGNSSTPLGTVPDIVSGTTLAGNQAGSFFNFNAAGGVVFGIDSNQRLFSGVDGGAWTLEATGVANWSIGLDPSTKNMYFFRGTDLYQKVYGGAEIKIASFNGSLQSPTVSAYHSSLAHSIVILDGNSIYTYTDAVKIP